MTGAPERIWVGADRGADWGYGWWVLLGPDDLDRTVSYIRADLAKAQAGALLRKAADFVRSHVYVTNGGERTMEPVRPKFAGMDQHHETIAARIEAIDPDAQAALDRYVREAVETDPRVKALVEALELQNIWVKAALECEAWAWDAQQHDAASESLDSARAALRAIGGE